MGRAARASLRLVRNVGWAPRAHAVRLLINRAG
jgi:hypothetical protein